MHDNDDLTPTAIDDPEVDMIPDELLPDNDEEFAAPPPPITDTPAEPASV